MVLDAQAHAVLAQDGFGERDGFLAAFEVLAELLEGVHVLVAASRHGGVQGDGAALAGGLHGGVEGRDSGFVARIAHVEDEAHVVAFHLLPERLDGFRIGAGQPRFHHAEAQVVAVLDEVERFGAAAAGARPYGEAGGRAAQVGQASPASAPRRGSTASHAEAAPAAPRICLLVIISDLLPT